MKEHPILFSGPMVLAILEGRKTVTRRVVNPQPSRDEHGFMLWEHRGVLITEQNTAWAPFDDGFPAAIADGLQWVCPYGKPGDRLWVREAWVADAQVNAVAPRDLSQGEPILYPADGAVRQTGCAMITPGVTRPSIHMPRWVSRILLEVTAVGVERLQDITEEQAVAEGVERPENIRDVDVWDGAERELFNAMNQPRDRFKRLWADINGVESWDANPWVWVVEFKRVEQSA